IHTPILLLTVRDQEQDIVRGLKMGADDYLTKPFSLPVLKARMDTILRRMNFDKNSCEFKCGNIRLDKKAKMVFIGEQPLELGVKEYELLEILMENEGLTLSRERILDILWGWEQDSVYDNTLTVTIKRLREKIVPYQNYIRTVRGIGYRLTEGEE
ncbi:MAG: response regulator transcription factor, partial [Candidatus Methanofastidiosa archaeon]|nr:response regulator transcription factor [Candidatus Methanofastidiosa archaeon]